MKTIFSLEDMKKAIEIARKTFPTDKLSCDRYSTEEFIQSLSTQIPKEFIPLIQIYDFDHGIGRSCIPRKILKTTTNSEGKQELVGTYKY